LKRAPERTDQAKTHFSTNSFARRILRLIQIKVFARIQPSSLEACASLRAPLPGVAGMLSAPVHERRPFKWRLLANFRYSPAGQRVTFAKVNI
jgi:hypothetical protein